MEQRQRRSCVTSLAEPQGACHAREPVLIWITGLPSLSMFPAAQRTVVRAAATA